MVVPQSTALRPDLIKVTSLGLPYKTNQATKDKTERRRACRVYRTRGLRGKSVSPRNKNLFGLLKLFTYLLKNMHSL